MLLTASAKMLIPSELSLSPFAEFKAPQKPRSHEGREIGNDLPVDTIGHPFEDVGVVREFLIQTSSAVSRNVSVVFSRFVSPK